MAEKRTNSEKLDEILNILAERKHLDSLVIKHDEWINGNGKPGAKTQLEIMTTSQKRISALNSAIVLALIIDIVAGFIQ